MCISLWELIIFHAVFMACVIVYAREVSVRHNGIKNSDTYPFEALPHYHYSSICQNYFATSTAKAFPQCITHDFDFNCNLQQTLFFLCAFTT